MALYPPESLDFIINHVILPPKLPQEADDPQTSRAAEQHLLQLLSLTTDSYCHQYQQDTHGTSSTFTETWRVIKTMLSRCATVISAHNLSTELLTGLFAQLVGEGMLQPSYADSALV